MVMLEFERGERKFDAFRLKTDAESKSYQPFDFAPQAQLKMQVYEGYANRFPFDKYLSCQS